MAYGKVRRILERMLTKINKQNRAKYIVSNLIFAINLGKLLARFLQIPSSPHHCIHCIMLPNISVRISLANGIVKVVSDALRCGELL